MRNYRKIKVNMRSDSLHRVIRAYLSDTPQSRTSVSESLDICRATASKVADALIESGFMCERLFSLDGKQRPRLHLFLRETLRFLLIDFSSPRFRMCVISNDSSILFESSHNYDSSISFNDNTNIFLSRCGMAIKASGYTFSAISVLYADSEQKIHIENSTQRACLPSIRQKESVSQAICEIFRKEPTLHLTVSDAICEELRYSTIDSNMQNGVSYIFVGSRLFAFHSYNGSSKTVCSPEKLLSTDEKDITVQPYLASKEFIDDLFIKLCGFMDAAFSPSLIILESDLHAPDDITARKINRSFALSSHNAPLIYTGTVSAERPILTGGILRSTAFALISSYISVI